MYEREEKYIYKVKSLVNNNDSYLVNIKNVPTLYTDELNGSLVTHQTT
jgi:hypothetical protein